MSNVTNSNYKYTITFDFDIPMEKEAYEKIMAFTRSKNITIKQFLLEQILGEEIYKKWLEVQGAKIVDYNSQINENVRIMAETMKLFQESCAEMLNGIKLSVQSIDRTGGNQNQQDFVNPQVGGFQQYQEMGFDPYGDYIRRKTVMESIRDETIYEK